MYSYYNKYSFSKLIINNYINSLNIQYIGARRLDNYCIISLKDIY